MSFNSVGEALDLLVAPFSHDGDWDEIVQRASAYERQPTRRRRRLLVSLVAAALVVIALATPVGGAIVRGLGDFSDWLTGHPGTPASQSERKAFARETHSWFGFPAHTALRRLVVSRQGGLTAELYGFRSSDALCLRLVVSGSASGVDLACAPLAELRARKQPALVLASDYGLGVSAPVSDGPLVVRPPRALLTVGIVADGVNRIIVGRSDGTRTTAVVHGDAFASLALHPSPELRVTHVWAERAGKRVSIPFVAAPTPLRPMIPGQHQQPAGPSSVQRPLHTGSIGWFARRVLRGQAVPQQLHHIGLVGGAANVIFERMVAPDAQSPERVVISLLPAGHRFFGGRLHDNNQVCAELVGGVYSAGRTAGGGCWPAGRLFSTGPFTEAVTQGQNNQYVNIVGLASDDVARLRLYLSTGEYVPVALSANAYVVRAPLTKYPLRLVGYDGRGRVIGITTLWGNTRMPPIEAAPIQGAKWRTVIHNTAGTLMTAPSTKGGTCLGIRYRGGAMIECPPHPAPRSISVGATHVGGGLTITGTSGSQIARIVVQLRSGDRVTVKPVDGFVFTFLAHQSTREVIAIMGFDQAGRQLTRTRFSR